jgi:hypothetical protein
MRLSALRPACTSRQNHRFLANWDITKLVKHWLDNPDAPRGQFIIVNTQHSVWVQWEGKLPHVYARIRIEEPAADTKKPNSPPVPVVVRGLRFVGETHQRAGCRLNEMRVFGAEVWYAN